MKQFLLMTFLVLTGALIACKKSSSGFTPDCTNSYSYATDVAPLITTYCATNSRCHASGSSEGPGALTSYSAIYNNRGSIGNSVSSGSMPQGTTLTDAQKTIILCWISGGAPQN